MKLLKLASFRQFREELAQFYSNEQPSTLTSPNSLEKQMAGTKSDLSSQTEKELKNYREYKRKRDKEKGLKEKRKSLDPLLPNSLKKEIKRSKVIKSDDIAPTI